MSSCAPPGQKRRLFNDAGRACPVDYRIPADAFAGDADISCDVLYVAGGLYGNPFAAQAIDDLVASELSSAGRKGCEVKVVLNGDMHWFDKTAQNFEQIEKWAARYIPLVGNVEAELRRQEDVGVGCGCAYPACTADDSVARSNRIHKMLSYALDAQPHLKDLLLARPSVLVANVAGRRIGITHGDEKLLGGWDNSRESLSDILRQDEVDTFMAANNLDVFTTTHTCAPAAIRLARGVVINNGSAGLPNFLGEDYGLCVRIAARPREDSLFGCEIDGLYIQAVPVRYDHSAYLAWFDDLWEPASAAAISYRDRIACGPDDRIIDSLLGGFSLERAARSELSARQQAGLGPNASHATYARHATRTPSAPHAPRTPSAPHAPRTRRTPRATEDDVHMALEHLLYFDDMLQDDSARVTEAALSVMQVNITARCNLACAHCHVKSSPARKEAMSREVLEAVLKVARERGMETIDITGGAPEMHPNIEWFLREAARAVPHVMLRSNLVVLKDPKYAHLVDLFDELGIEVVASLPNVFEAEAEAQRGHSTYDATLDVLRDLNRRGYGSDGKHILNLVFNPQEPVLPPLQEDVEEMYRRRLANLGIVFNKLFAVANNPIGRYGAKLLDDKTFDAYMDTLIDAFNPETCANMMCRHQMSVGWDGTVYDCDFNQAIGLKASSAQLPEGVLSRSDIDRALMGAEGGQLTIFDYADNPTRSLRRPIVFGNHCYACTAGFGSSCGGTLVQD